MEASPRSEQPGGLGTIVALAPTPQDMQRLGAALGQVLRPGDTVLLGGDLGAGKTTFTQGLAGALGVTGPVTSPTFVLVHSYRTHAGCDLLHADVWRLEQLQEVIDLAIPEMLDEGAAAVVEWGELAAPALASDCLHIGIDFEPEERGPSSNHSHRADAGGCRRLVFRPIGRSWQQRSAALEAAIGATSGRAGEPAGPDGR